MGIEQAVENVLEGNHALSGEFNKRAVPFTKNADARAALVRACAQLCADIKDSVDVDQDSALTPLIAKMAAYCTKQGWKTETQIDDGMKVQLPNIAAAIMNKPQMVQSKAGIAGMLKKYYQCQAQEESFYRQRVINDNHASPLHVMSGQDGFTLVELLNTAHLKAESAALDHCVGRAYNQAVLKERNIPEFSPEAERYLAYGMKVRNKSIRIFSLRDSFGKSRVTIEYDAERKRIAQVKGKANKTLPSASYFPALCEVLHRLKDMLDLSGGMAGLPKAGKNRLMTRHGRIDYRKDYPLEDVFAGEVIITENMSKAQIRDLARCPNITLDVSFVTCEWLDERLPKTVEAELYSDQAEPFILKNVEKFGDVNLVLADSVEFLAAKEINDLVVERAKRVYMPTLEKAHFIYGESLQFLRLPALSHAKEIWVSEAKAVALPALEKIRDIWAGKATIDIPENSAAFIEGQPVKSQDTMMAAASAPNPAP